MGAGNAKGLRKSASADDVDDISVASDGQWDDNRPQQTHSKNEDSTNDHHRSKSFDFPQQSDRENDNLRVIQDNAEGQPAKRDNKRGGFFHFRKEKDENKIEDESESELESKENENRRFKFFGRKKDTKPQKDDKLDSEINDLEKTFDSLGILGKENKKDGGENNSSTRNKDDLDSLEPMRNRQNVRIARPPRGLNGLTTGRDFLGRRNSDFTASSGSGKKKFNFSWESDEETQRPTKQDEWSYETVRIEGFDINKFKQANKQNSMEMNIKGSISAPVSSGGMGSSSSNNPYGRHSPSSTPTSPLHYDADDKRILESIERALGD
ncbi:hypothetical protein FHG87_013172 [Trinorchestia longiramus]|nr:hypothetical protein FHG87_013172 [Trinorchestia longiramus]